MNRRQRQYEAWKLANNITNRWEWPTDDEVIRAIETVPEHFAPITFVTSASASSSDAGVTANATWTPTGANWLVAVVSDYAAVALGSVTDDVSNTWTQVGTLQTDGVTVSRVSVWQAVNPGSLANAIVTYRNASLNTFPAIGVAAFNAVKTATPYDTVAGQNGGGGPAELSQATGNITPSQGGSLCIAGLCFFALDTISVNSGWNLPEQRNYTAGLAFGMALAYQIQTTATIANATFSWSTNPSNAAATIVSFKAASPPAGGGLFRPATISGLGAGGPFFTDPLG